MCHESSGVALAETIGIGKGTVTLDDVHAAELISSPARTRAPTTRACSRALEQAKRNGAAIVAINPLPEAGLIAFRNPQRLRGSGRGTRCACSRAESMRGWLVPGFCPATRINSAEMTSSRVTVPLPIPIVSWRATPLDSWHMFEQSGRLFVPNARANSWYKKAASLLVRPDV